ncbi:MULTISPECIES: glycoside hydrolase family 28 protein [unclassified Crossiella]|uniref:glycoside hydrolase family 28 protein n=1 Tax=unclassified Crossiella TaxID=2620835 RepID=UPI001FFF9685|nr:MULTISPECIES: glycoside hydrolase family 28 protein [unclassified Crossiella]MCK2239536.1 glycoside hydrolase family 28 protein [Crossiella sp. S99.2]MCK2252231.1 glycoside hydrolase family 28 protein [Crossiella sp. S99.1]
MGPSRRDFLKVTGLAAGGLLLPGAAFAGERGAAGDAVGPHATSGLPGAADPWDAVPGILARIVPPTFPARDFPVTGYGGKGDGKADNTAAFRAAIAACVQAGGGRVVVPPGTFLTGAIHLASNVNLHIQSGGIIRFSTDPAKFLPVVRTRWQGIECMNYSPFIYAYEATNVALTGSGRIDGQAANGPWFDFDPKRQPDWEKLQKQAVDNVPPDKRVFGGGHFLKPNMIQFYRCRNVLVEGLDIRNPAMWTVHPVLCRNVTVRGVTIYSRGGMVDGVDPEASADVHVTGCTFDTGDDGVVIKSGRDIDGRRVGVPSENIVVEKCTFLGRWGAIAVGSEMSGGVRNVFAQDITIRPGPNYKTFHAVYIKTNKRRGGTVDGVHVRRLTADKIDRGAVFITMNYSLTGPGFGPIANPSVRNVTLDQLTVRGTPWAVRLDGLAESHIQDVRISNSTFTEVKDTNISIKNADRTVFSNVKVNGKPVS